MPPCDRYSTSPQLSSPPHPRNYHLHPSASQPVEYLRTNGRSYGVETCFILSGALRHPIAIRADHIGVRNRVPISKLLLLRSARHRGLMTSKLKLIETQIANRCNLECGPAQRCGPVHGRQVKRRLLNWYRIVGANSQSRPDRHMASDCLRLQCDRSKSALFGLEKKVVGLEKKVVFLEKNLVLIYIFC
jgi:hypothetical protein